MSGTTKITTRTQGWQTTCRQWASSGESFEIHDLGAANLAFCQELCETYNYECHYQSHGSKIAMFTPIAS